MITLMEYSKTTICYKLFMNMNGVFDGVQSSPTEGGGSLDEL